MAFILCIQSQLSAQTIEGKVSSVDGYPCPYSLISLLQSNYKTLSDDNGHFVFNNVHIQKDTLIIMCLGFKPLKKIITINSNGKIDLGNIKMEYGEELLQDVEITGRAAHSYKSDYSFFTSKSEAAVKDVPQSVSTITKELIQDKMEFTLKDAASDAAGVNIYSGYDEYTIRGFRAENARDINGLRGYNTTYTSSMLVNVEQVEIIKGPTATLYGNCDPGGTINLVTKKPLQTNQGELNIYGGIWNHFRTEGDITGPINKSKTLLFRLNAGYDNTQSFRLLNYSKAYEIAPSLSYVPNDKIRFNIDFSLSHINTILDRGQPGYLNESVYSTTINLTATQPGDYLHETDVASIASVDYKINKHFSFSSGYLNYITQQNVAEHGISNYITPDSVDLYYSTWYYHTVTNTVSNYFTYKLSQGKFNLHLLAGYDFVQSKVDLTQTYFELPGQFGVGSGIVGTFSLKNPQYPVRPVSTYVPEDTDSSGANDVDADVYHTQGIYFQGNAAYGKVQVLFGLRKEFYKGDEDDDSTGGGNIREQIYLPRVGLVYDVTHDISVYATYNKGFDPYEAASEIQIFNAPFKPITSKLYEVGAKGDFFQNKLFASLAVYQLTLGNVAVNANILSDPNLFIQQGRDQSQGLEAELRGNILSNLSVSATYAYCVAKITQSKIVGDVGTILENAPKNSSSSWIKYSFAKGKLKGFGIAAGHSQASERNTLAPGFTLPGYCIFNAGIHYSFKHMLFAFNVNNIANETYWIGAYNYSSKWPGTPRNYLANIAYRF